MTTHWSLRRCLTRSHTVVLPLAVPPAQLSFGSVSRRRVGRIGSHISTSASATSQLMC